MNNVENASGFVNSEVETEDKNLWEPVDFIVVRAGLQLRAYERTKGVWWRGGKRDGDVLGRQGAQDTTPEQQAENEKTKWRRRKRDLRDTCDANVLEWLGFDTLTYGYIERNIDQFLDDFDIFKKFVVRKVRERFDSDFVFNYAGAYDLQDGKRRKDKKGILNLHLHFLSNLPFWKTYVIVSKIKKPETGKYEEHYLLNDGTWSKIATRDTLYFDAGDTPVEDKQARNEVQMYLKRHKKQLSAKDVTGIKFKALPYYTIAWGKGFLWREWIDEKRENGKIAGFGEYVASNYLTENMEALQKKLEEYGQELSEEEKEVWQHFFDQLKGRKGWLHSEFETSPKGEVKRPGGLKRPEKFYNDEAKALLRGENAWDCLTAVGGFPIDLFQQEDLPPDEEPEKDHVICYEFNLWRRLYDWIQTVSLDDRSVLHLPEDVECCWTAFDEEQQRRKTLEQVHRRMFEQRQPPSPQVVQQEMFSYYAHSCV